MESETELEVKHMASLRENDWKEPKGFTQAQQHADWAKAIAELRNYLHSPV
jgi:hypothetical protein